MDAIELLKADHEKVRGLFEQLTKTTSRAEKTRPELLAKIRLELDVHTQIEEEIFYPAFQKAAEESDDRELIFEALEEHRAAGELVLPDLLETEIASERFGGRAKVLKDLVEHHAEEEEKEMFPKARKLLAKEQLVELGAQMAARKKELIEMGAEQIELMKKTQGQKGSEQAPANTRLQ